MLKLLLMASILSGGGFAWSSCDQVLRSLNREESPTTTFLALLYSMVERQIISVEDYAQLVQKLEKGPFLLPLSDTYIWAQKVEARAMLMLLKAYLQHWKESPGYIDQSQIAIQASQNLKKWNKESGQRLHIGLETISPFVKIEWIKISAGKFMMGQHGYGEREVVIPHDFMAQKTKVTQKMWFDLMENNPSYFKTGEGSIVVEKEGKKIAMRPNHPVETVLFHEVLEYANKLSEREGFKPVYDLGLAQSNGVKINGGGSIYETEGYRLPTLAEWEYLSLAGGNEEQHYVMLNQGLPLTNLGWFYENSQEGTQQVGEKAPNFYGIYDLYGNVKEFVSDWYGADFPRGSEVRLSGESEESHFRCISKGSSWNTSVVHYTVSATDEVRVLRASREIGFRLVRTLK